MDETLKRQAGDYLQDKIHKAAFSLLDDMEVENVDDICKAIAMTADVQQELTGKMLAYVTDEVMPDASDKRFAWNMANGMASMYITALLALISNRNTLWGDDELVVDQFKAHLQGVLKHASASMIEVADAK
jgi:hypothetical protein